jgi:hypothetical protein
MWSGSVEVREIERKELAAAADSADAFIGYSPQDPEPSADAKEFTGGEIVMLPPTVSTVLVGDRVRVDMVDGTGTVRFIGENKETGKSVVSIRECAPPSCCNGTDRPGGCLVQKWPAVLCRFSWSCNDRFTQQLTTISFSYRPLVGVEMDSPTGKCDGSFRVSMSRVLS